ncbi:hypothetical protein ABB37_01869 [Leptomonas pyrrhocoris]|uniref:Uncharacterized protein n=1 Tax=Leptomonas pyrrhocoris TaxID=157538 RepID=A0A0N0VGP5_LEPPY|nr:hypothetical protein ABB37_01869 [Leptomonas pyrrhocoris]XP_015662017.1 hypothetical protein ABB37_01869 [Leptomonas pyrrhocoris]KPA83577.1 hypothetical protein ABB37_01869 [Leptomonas pyrrhocoris]KPA83578.1 hypothetical protein ABB37_01869 [Leptomonas pyrrhocoris]|eukprot:XP_015662016.1 hypothetical protein ABB37_01869 [Leptomonas pyrrhocoris]
MRYSYYRGLIHEERRKRGPHYGRQARIRQLTVLTVLLLGLYVACTYNIWRHPRPIQHVWIDDVLVEVISENWIDHARSGLLCLGLCCAGLLGLAYLCAGVRVSSASPVDGADGAASRARESRGKRGGQKPEKDISTIAVPAWARRRAAGQQPISLTSMEALRHTSDGVGAAATAADRTSAFDERRPMRTDNDLNAFLAYEAAHVRQQQRQRLSVADGAGVRYRGTAEDNICQSDVDVVGRDALSVTYEGGGVQRRSNRSGGGGADSAAAASSFPFASVGAAPTPSTLPWAELGISHVDEALQRTREWMSDVCRKLIDDIDQCDRWFNEHQIEAYDCHHSLQELLPAPTATAAATAPSQARPGSWWGTTSAAPSFSVPASPQLESKLTALLREKAYCRQAQQGMQELDTALRYDQRLALEARLDISGTFPSPASSVAQPTNAALTAMREYVVDRLRTFAKQRFLVSYHASGGDAATWRSGYPCDAHLLLHVLRVSVKGLSEYVRFGYQTGTQTQDLALCVGDTGEPYFYVRFRQGSSETLLPTRQGPTSLMEAVLAFAAVIHTYHRDVFGGVRGTVDLAEVGLLRAVAENRPSDWGVGADAEW